MGIEPVVVFLNDWSKGFGVAVLCTVDRDVFVVLFLFFLFHSVNIRLSSADRIGPCRVTEVLPGLDRVSKGKHNLGCLFNYSRGSNSLAFSKSASAASRCPSASFARPRSL